MSEFDPEEPSNYFQLGPPQTLQSALITNWLQGGAVRASLAMQLCPPRSYENHLNSGSRGGGPRKLLEVVQHSATKMMSEVQTSC